jgi:AcrR family transcriptional regulator
MDVATRLFAERGYDATTTAGIAAAAGVSEPILYRHFRSKQELFISIITLVTLSIREKWRELLSSVKDPAQAIAMISKHWPEHMRNCALEYGVIHTAMISSKDPEVIRVLRIHYEEMEKGMMEIVGKGQEMGVFVNTDLYSTARWILHTGIGYTFQSLTLGVPEKFDMDTGIQLTLRAIRTGRHVSGDGDGDGDGNGERVR